jgi:hypothetical protein
MGTDVRPAKTSPEVTVGNPATRPGMADRGHPMGPVRDAAGGSAVRSPAVGAVRLSPGPVDWLQRESGPGAGARPAKTALRASACGS